MGLQAARARPGRLEWLDGWNGWNDRDDWNRWKAHRRSSYRQE
jgi:hypothetical protein